MTLRSRAIALIAVTVLGGVVLFALSAFAVVRSGYRELGRAAAEDLVDGVAHTVQDELVRLRRTAEPLGSSVNAVAFARSQPEGDSFLLRIGSSALERYDIDALVVLDPLGAILHVVADDEVPEALIVAARDPVLRVPDPVTRSAEGVLIAESGPAVALARPITGPISAEIPAGTLVFLRDLGDPLVSQDALGLRGVTFSGSQPSFVRAPFAPNRRQVREDGSARATYTDQAGRTVLTVDASVPASIRSAESATLRRLVVLSVALAAGVGLTLLVWFERRLLSRLTRLTGLVSASTRGEGRPEVALGGDDELSQLADRIESTLRSLEATERELRSTNTQLEEAAEIKNDFVSVVSHELRTPLTSILGFTETLRSRLDELPEERTRYLLERMSVQAHTLDRMVEELLVLSRMSSGRMRHEPQVVEIGALVTDVVRSLATGEPIACDPPATDLPVLADPDHLRRILTNFVENARKYGAGPVEVGTDVVDGTVTIRVRDHGPGVPAEFVEELFEPFTQASAGTTRTARGVGLGLSIVQTLARTNGGRAWYEPGDPGAVFAVAFPLLDTGAPAPESTDGRGDRSVPSTLTRAR